LNLDSRQYKVLLHMQQNLVIGVRALWLAAQSLWQAQDHFGQLYRRGVDAPGKRVVMGTSRRVWRASRTGCEGDGGSARRDDRARTTAPPAAERGISQKAKGRER